MTGPLEARTHIKDIMARPKNNNRITTPIHTHPQRMAAMTTMARKQIMPQHLTSPMATPTTPLGTNKKVVVKKEQSLVLAIFYGKDKDRLAYIFIDTDTIHRPRAVME